MTDWLFHLLTQDQWLALTGSRSIAAQTPIIDRPHFHHHKTSLPPYAPPSLAQEGFIHLSTRSQVCGVADRFYRNQGTLILLAIDPQQLQGEIRWEAPAHPDGSPPEANAPRFPHLYGSLNWDAVIEVYDLPQHGGQFTLPPALLCL